MSAFDSVNKIWSNPKPNKKSLDENVSFREIILNRLRSTPDKIFQISEDDGTELTYTQIELMSIRVAQNLKLFGVNAGDVVTTFVNNSSLVAPLVFGSFLLGASINPISGKTGLNFEWITAVFEANKPKVIIMEDCLEYIVELIEIARKLKLDCKIFISGESRTNCYANVFHTCELLKETRNEKTFQ